MSAAEKEEFKKAALANARCMREHGIDFPDPKFEPDGGARVKIGKGLEPGGGQVPGGAEGVREDAARRAEHLDGRRG